MHTQNTNNQKISKTSKCMQDPIYDEETYKNTNTSLSLFHLGHSPGVVSNMKSV